MRKEKENRVTLQTCCNMERDSSRLTSSSWSLILPDRSQDERFASVLTVLGGRRLQRLGAYPMTPRGWVLWWPIPLHKNTSTLEGFKSRISVYFSFVSGPEPSKLVYTLLLFKVVYNALGKYFWTMYHWKTLSLFSSWILQLKYYLIFKISECIIASSLLGGEDDNNNNGDDDDTDVKKNTLWRKHWGIMC